MKLKKDLHGVSLVTYGAARFAQGFRKLANVLLALLHWMLYANVDLNTQGKVLVFRTGSIGDNICAMPALYAIRKAFPKAQIHILINAGRSNLVSLESLYHPDHYDRLIDYLGYPKRKLFQLLKDEHYDCVIQLAQNGATLPRLLRDTLVFRSIGIKRGFGWEYETFMRFRKAQLRVFDFTNERDRLLNMLRKHGVPTGEIAYPLNIKDEHREKVRKLIEERNLSDRSRNIGMVVGAKRLPNRWSAANFEMVSQHFRAKGYRILIAGGKDDIEAGNKITGAYSFCGQLLPVESAVLFSHCRFTISNDTGPMHLSYAVGTPVLAIFSARDFSGKWFPPNDGMNHVLRDESVDCAVCLLEACPYQNLCIEKVTPEQVIEQAERMIELTSTNP
ncbi:MAG: hypothetical protein GC164_07380 [Phycisphaera sp.]|nr:hypothetical protein [Phycisphaera sp.]